MNTNVKKHHARNYLKHIEALKSKGFKVKVRHDRLYCRYSTIIEKRLKKDYHYQIISHEVLMTKGEMKNAGLFDYELENYGGCTTVSIFKDEQLVAEGQAKVNKSDHFVRHIGLEIACGRAMKQIK